MNIVFAGTPEFAVPTLSALLEAGHNIISVYTQPDRRAGRGRKPQASAVKRLALEHGLPLHQPTSLKSGQETAHLAALSPELVVVVAYGQLLPAAILAIPQHGCINVHASLLPRWRGAAPIARAIEAGDKHSGVSIMQMDVGLDTGPVLAQANTPIDTSDTAHSLHDRLAELGAQQLLNVLTQLEAATLNPQAQDETHANYAPKLSKAEAAIDWQLAATVLHCKIRAFNPWPVVSTYYNDKPLRLWEVAPQCQPTPEPAAPGTLLAVARDGITIQTGDGALTITRLQAQGGKVLAVAEFLNGHRLVVGERFGTAVAVAAKP